MELAVKILALIPFGIEVLLLMTLQKEGLGALEIPILIAILLGIIGVCIINKKSILQKIGIVALIILTILFCIMAYYDDIQGFSLGVGIIIFIYFIFIKMAYKNITNK